MKVSMLLLLGAGLALGGVGMLHADAPVAAPAPAAVTAPAAAVAVVVPTDPQVALEDALDVTQEYWFTPNRDYWLEALGLIACELQAVNPAAAGQVIARARQEVQAAQAAATAGKATPTGHGLAVLTTRLAAIDLLQAAMEQHEVDAAVSAWQASLASFEEYERHQHEIRVLPLLVRADAALALRLVSQSNLANTRESVNSYLAWSRFRQGDVAGALPYLAVAMKYGRHEDEAGWARRLAQADQPEARAQAVALLELLATDAHRWATADWRQGQGFVALAYAAAGFAKLDPARSAALVAELDEVARATTKEPVATMQSLARTYVAWAVGEAQWTQRLQTHIAQYDALLASPQGKQVLGANLTPGMPDIATLTQYLRVDPAFVAACLQAQPLPANLPERDVMLTDWLLVALAEHTAEDGAPAAAYPVIRTHHGPFTEMSRVRALVAVAHALRVAPGYQPPATPRALRPLAPLQPKPALPVASSPPAPPPPPPLSDDEKIRHLDMANLKTIGLALLMYSGDHHAKFPPDLAALADGQFLPPGKVYCYPGPSGAPEPKTAADLRQGTGDYVYVGAGLRDDADDATTLPMVVRRPACAPGWAAVLYVAGNAESFPTTATTCAAVVQQVYDRAKATTLSAAQKQALANATLADQGPALKASPPSSSRPAGQSGQSGQ